VHNTTVPGTTFVPRNAMGRPKRVGVGTGVSNVENAITQPIWPDRLQPGADLLAGPDQHVAAKQRVAEGRRALDLDVDDADEIYLRPLNVIEVPVGEAGTLTKMDAKTASKRTAGHIGNMAKSIAAAGEPLVMSGPTGNTGLGLTTQVSEYCKKIAMH
jgi:hypothetical protein